MVLWIPRGGSRESCCHPRSTGTCRRSFLGRARQQAEDIGIGKETKISTNSHPPHLVHWPPECSLLERVGGGSLAGDALEDVHAARVARHLHRLAQLGKYVSVVVWEVQMWDEESLVQYLGLGMCYSLSTVQCDLQDSIVIARLRSEDWRKWCECLLNLNEFYLNVTGISFTFFTINLQEVVLKYVKLALADVGNISKQTPWTFDNWYFQSWRFENFVHLS